MKILLKKNIFSDKLFVLLTLIMCALGITLKGEELPEKVIISYNFPNSKGSTLLTDTFTAATMVDAKQAVWQWDLEPGEEDYYRDYWRDKGKAIILRPSSYFATGRTYTQNELNALFEENIELYDGIAIDEIYSAKWTLKSDGTTDYNTGINRVNIFVNALEYIRDNYPDKFILVYSCTYWDKTDTIHQICMQGLKDYADLVMEELYIRESFAINNNGVCSQLDRVEDIADFADVGIGGMLDKTVITLGIYSETMDRADVDIADHIRGQLQYIKNDSLLSQVRGIGIYSPDYASPGELEKINQVVIDHYLSALRLRFDESSGTTARDISGSDNNGTLTNFSTPACWINGKTANALEFDGVDDYVDCGNDSSLELKEFTYAAWINPNTVSEQYQQIIGKNHIWKKGFFISYDNLRAHVPQTGSSISATATNAITANVWQHVAMTYAQNTIKFYVNGQLISSTTDGSGDPIDQSACNMIISAPDNTFHGAMDDVRVYGCALTADDIDKIYQDVPLQLRLRLNGGSSVATANDSSDCGNEGTLNNFNTSSCWISGKTGNALEFDGADDYVDCGNDSSLELKEFTYAAWIKPDTVGEQYQQIIGKNHIWKKGFFLGYDDLRAHVPQTGSSISATASNVITANIWQHVAMTYAQNTIKFYVNGQLISSTTDGSGDPIDQSACNMIISAPDNTFHGSMDDIRVYPCALTDAQITAIYDEVPANQVQLELKMNESSGAETTDDASDFDNDGTLINFNTSICWVSGMSGNALEFDGVDDHVDCDNAGALELNEFTYTAWIKPNSVSEEYQQIIGKNHIWKKGFFLGYDNLRGHVPQTGSSVSATAINAITLNTWQHVAMTYANNTIKLYVDGDLISTTTDGYGDPVSQRDYNMVISAPDNTFHGLIDDVRVYPRALNETEIDAIYQE